MTSLRDTLAAHRWDAAGSKCVCGHPFPWRDYDDYSNDNFQAVLVIWLADHQYEQICVAAGAGPNDGFAVLPSGDLETLTLGESMVDRWANLRDAPPANLAAPKEQK